MMKLPIASNVVIVGETGRGKTDVMVCTQKTFFAKSDVSQLRDISCSEEAERCGDAVRKNCNAQIYLKPFNPHGEISDE
jgi:hypothetical protein